MVRWRPLRGMSLVLLLSVLAAGTIFMVPGRAAAGPALLGAWEQTGLSNAATEIITPSSGALFARTGLPVMRSDDAGQTWRKVNGPGPSDGAVVDRFDHTRLYGLYARSNAPQTYHMLRSVDDGASWQMILEAPPVQTGWRLLPDTAASGLIYFPQTATVLTRSEDGGDTWITTQTAAHPKPEGSPPCDWEYRLVPHPSNPEQVARYATCVPTLAANASRDYTSRLAFQVERSTHRGQSWTTVDQGGYREGSGEPHYLLKEVAGCGIGVARLYRSSAAVRAPSGDVDVGETLDRSDDGGENWTALRTDRAGTSELLPSVACNPTNPDQVFIARQEKGTGGNALPISVLATADGGQTWSDTGLPAEAKTRALAVGIDGGYLFAATDKGVWRLALKG